MNGDHIASTLSLSIDVEHTNIVRFLRQCFIDIAETDRTGHLVKTVQQATVTPGETAKTEIMASTGSIVSFCNDEWLASSFRAKLSTAESTEDLQTGKQVANGAATKSE